MVESHRFYPTPSVFGAPLSVSHWNFTKTFDVVCVILCLAILVKLGTCDRRYGHSAYHTSTALHGKNSRI